MSDTLFRYGHFLAIFVMFACLFSQHLLLNGTVARSHWPRSVRLDATFGISAFLALVFGVSLWLWVGKPPGFYQGNWVFQSKIGLFVALVMLSFIPSQFIWRHHQTKTNAVLIPSYVIIALRGQLLLMCALPLMGVLMANGIGYVR